MSVDRVASDRAQRSLQKVTNKVDLYQAQLDRLNAEENAGLIEDQQEADEHREALETLLHEADLEEQDAEIAFERAMGDHEQADRLVAKRRERNRIAREAAEGLLRDLRKAYGEPEPEEDL